MYARVTQLTEGGVSQANTRSALYNSANTHGVKTAWGKAGSKVLVPYRPEGGPRAYVFENIPGANTARAVARGAAIAGGILGAANLLVLFDFENQSLMNLAQSTVRARNRPGGLSLWDEAFALLDLYDLTQDPVSAAWAWNVWSDGLNSE